jgi:hypothetical protein
MILLIYASRVARIIIVSHQCPTKIVILKTFEARYGGACL